MLLLGWLLNPYDSLNFQTLVQESTFVWGLVGCFLTVDIYIYFFFFFFFFPVGESIQIFAEIENCSSRMVVPKAAIYQTQAFYAKGKMKEVKQLVANLRGESLSSGKTETWNGKLLKIPPVSPSILDCSIIRVEYSLMVRTDLRVSSGCFLKF